ncbi:MAG: bifunctional phosphopantothenoylcysteine decarboxylase/phosphopantothenate--cysteine ligase CoaBC [Bacteroidales bacterium]|nr:bifunctional phosphopantothenoylcysteine decarboxylase/phosphopantothenate--cysteine ligase CoaBC [Bacteroidales bacterium]
MLKDKKIVIGITGSIAAFKIPILVRLFKKEGAEVKIMMTPAARDFVTPLTLSTLSGNPVIIEPFNPEDGTWNSHVELGQWADIYLLSPVSANTLAKMAHGIADNFFLTAFLSAKCPVFFAPAMDLDMFRHPATQKNIEILQSYGHYLIDPAVGELASGLSGAGRMEEPENIFQLINDFFSEKKSKLSGKKVLVTAGPTNEAIDPVRFIGNHSSGLMGFSIAEEFAAKGADVTLVTGPVALNLEHPGIRRIDVTSADEMFEACMAVKDVSEIIVMAAAVADYKPAVQATVKIKKSEFNLDLKLRPTRDILAGLGKEKKSGQILVGFALETDHEEENARKKLESKNLDIIVLNSLCDEGAGFKTPTNKVTVLFNSGRIQHLPLKSKKEIAQDIINSIESII